VFVPVLALSAAACQTLEDVPPSVINTWRPAPLARADDARSRTTGPNGTPLLDNTARTKTTFLEGSGRFIGEPPTGAINPTTEAAADGVTINLVNVPAPQAAKTVLGDILGVRYTVDPGIEGKVTIQTPRPVARAAVVDMFQAALRSNNAALVNANGMYRIVALEQAAVGARIRTDEAPAVPEQLGSGVHIVQLKYVAASEIRRILDPISPRNDARLMAGTLRELGFALVGDGAQLDLDKAGLGQQNPGFGERRRHRHAHHLDDL